MNAAHVRHAAPAPFTRRTRARRLLMAATCAAAVLTAPAQLAWAGRVGARQAHLVRLTGRLGPPAPGETGTTDLTLMLGRTEYPFQLKDLRVLSGDILPGAILSEVTLHRPSYYLRGDDSMLQPIASAAGQTVTISGYTRLGSHDLFVTAVEIAAPLTRGATDTWPRMVATSRAARYILRR